MLNQERSAETMTSEERVKAVHGEDCEPYMFHTELDGIWWEIQKPCSSRTFGSGASVSFAWDDAASRLAPAQSAPEKERDFRAKYLSEPQPSAPARDEVQPWHTGSGICPVCLAHWWEHNEWQRGYCQGKYVERAAQPSEADTIAALPARPKLVETFGSDCIHPKDFREYAEAVEQQITALRAELAEKDARLIESRNVLTVNGHFAVARRINAALRKGAQG